MTPVFSSQQYGPFLPVSRAWNFVKDGVNQVSTTLSCHAPPCPLVLALGLCFVAARPPAGMTTSSYSAWAITRLFLSAILPADPQHTHRVLCFQDWDYVIFDWDNIFATYMTSLDSKDIACKIIDTLSI